MKEDALNIGTIPINKVAPLIENPTSSMLARMVIFNKCKQAGVYNPPEISLEPFTISELKGTLKQFAWKGSLADLSRSRYTFYKGKSDEWHELKEHDRVWERMATSGEGEYGYMADMLELRKELEK